MRYQEQNLFLFLKQKLLIKKDIFRADLQYIRCIDCPIVHGAVWSVAKSIFFM
jgi:hypothetical protein